MIGGQICAWFSLEDLFVVGLALDLMGAYFLGRSVIARMTFGGGVSTESIDPAEAIEKSNNEIDGWAGIAALCAGFLVQGAGYVVMLDGHSFSVGGYRRAVGGIALAVLVAVAAFGVWRFLGWRLLRGRLIHYSTWRYEGRSYRNPPDVELLARAADELGRPPVSGETRREYVARVFRLEDVDDPLNFDAETTDAWMAALRAGEYLTAYNIEGEHGKR